MTVLAELTARFRSVWPLLDERTRRIMAASEAMALGYGGVSLVRRACGLSRKAIAKGIGEIDAGTALVPGRIRRPGAGRKPITISDPQLVETLEAMIADQTRGDPESPLRWICKSTRTIAHELSGRHHPVSYVKVAQLLHGLDYSLQGNRKTEQGDDHPDRDAQFQHIAAAVKRCLAQGCPVIQSTCHQRFTSPAPCPALDLGIYGRMDSTRRLAVRRAERAPAAGVLIGWTERCCCDRQHVRPDWHERTLPNEY